MPITSWPFDDGADTTEAQYGQLFAELQDSGVAADADSPALSVTPAAGLSVDVAPGQAIVRGHYMDCDATVNLPLAAAGATGRRDLVVVRLDLVAKRVDLAVLTGSSPTVDPPLTQTRTGTYEVPLARVTVSAGAVTLSGQDVTDLRTFVGARVGAWTTSTRPASPRRGTTGWNTATAQLETWTGTTWSDLPTSIDATKVTSGTLAVARVPDLPASKTTSGTFNADRVPLLDASKISSGTLAEARLPTRTRASLVLASTFATGWRQPVATYREKLRFWRDVYGTWHARGTVDNSATVTSLVMNLQYILGTLPTGVPTPAYSVACIARLDISNRAAAQCRFVVYGTALGDFTSGTAGRFGFQVPDDDYTGINSTAGNVRIVVEDLSWPIA